MSIDRNSEKWKNMSSAQRMAAIDAEFPQSRPLAPKVDHLVLMTTSGPDEEEMPSKRKRERTCPRGRLGRSRR